MSGSPSRRRLLDCLARAIPGAGLYITDPMYHATVELTCRLLDVVDEVADPETAQRITDAIYDRVTAADAEATQKLLAARRLFGRLL